jgi:subtilisin family serine protease
MVVLALSLSMAAVLVSTPASSSGENLALEKFEPDLKKQLDETLKTSPSSMLRTVVFLTPGTDVSRLAASLASRGAVVIESYSVLGGLAISASADSLVEIASLAEVDRILVDEKRSAVPVPEGDFAWDLEMMGYTGGIWNASTPYVMGADKVWDEGITGNGVVVAVLDTGTDIHQADLADAIFDYKSFTSEEFHDADGHGTSTAGLIASRAVNTYYGFIKVQGLAPESMIMAGKVLGDDGYGWDSWIIAGIEWAVAGDDGMPGTGDEAQIISMSLGGLEVPNDGNDPSSLALDRAAVLGVVSFVAAGNEGMGRGTIGSPGVSKSTITVGASTNSAEAFYLLGYWPFTKTNGKYLAQDYENNHMIWWSSRGPTADGRIDPDLAAVGAWGPAPTPGNTVELQFGGTSMATPVAAGVGALVYQAYTKAYGKAPTPAQMKAILMGTAKDLGYGPAEQGAGRVDAYAAYEAAVGLRDVGGTTSISLTLSPGQSKKVNLGTNEISSRVFMLDSSFQTSGQVQINKDWFYGLEVPEGISYLHVDLAFDQTYLFTYDVHEFTGIGFTDDHLNVVLYKVENGGWTMVNYAYDHTNTQELNAVVTPGSYVLRVWGAQYENRLIPFDLNFEMYKTVEWSWLTSNGPMATIKVPQDAQAGTHLAFIEVARNGAKSLIPVAVTVPMRIGVTVSGSIEVGHGIWSSMEGDWVYYVVNVPSGSEALTATLTWTDWNTDMDLYLINPARDVVAASLTPYLGGGLYGPWTTATGGTAEVVTVEKPMAGRWMIGMQNVFFGKLFEEPYQLVASLSSPVAFGDAAVLLSASPGMPATATTTISNSLDHQLTFGLMPVKSEVVLETEVIADTISSVNIGGTGYAEMLITVAPGTILMDLNIMWSNPDADVDVVVYATDGSNRGVLRSNGQSLSVANPVPGEWFVAVSLSNTDVTTEFELTKTVAVHPAWTELSVSPMLVKLEPLGSESLTLTVSAPMPGTYTGMVVAYDALTGCVYDRLAVTLVVS